MATLWMAFGCSPASTSSTSSPESSSPSAGASTDMGQVGATTAVPLSSAPPLLAGLTISTGDLQPAFDPATTDYTVTSLTALHPIEVTATAEDPTAAITVRGAPAASGRAQSVTLAPREDLVVEVQSAAGGKRYTVHYLPPDLPAYTVSSAVGAGDEDVLLTAKNTYLLLVDRAGAPLFYRSFAPLAVENFQRHAVGGEVYYSAATGTPFSWTLGHQLVLDSAFREIRDVQILPNRAHGALPSEGHDFVLLDPDHTIAISYVERTIDLSGLNPAWSAQADVMSALVQEVDHGSVVFEWDSADFPQLYAQSVDGNTFGAGAISDYLHLNAIDVDPADGNLLLSFRHADEILKVDRRTGAIVWTLGGRGDDFGLTAEQRFSHQHHVRVQPDGSLMLFDNGNNLHQTRVLSFRLDEAQRKVASFRVVYEKPADQPQSTYMGSAVQLDASRTMIGWGGWFTLDAAPSATEIVGGAPVWTLTFATPGVFSYRALPIPRL